MIINSIAGYELLPFQRTGCDYIKTRKYSLLADDMGLGKTIQSLWACKELEAKKVLVICPASIQLQWQAKIKEFNPDYTIEIADQKPLCVRHYYKWFVVMSYQRAVSEKTFQELKELEFDMVIIDEMHFLKNPTAKRTKRLLGKTSYLANAKKICLMTGTPILNRPSEAYMFLKFFAPSLLGPYLPWPIFVRRFCGFRGAGASRTDELESILSKFLLRRVKEEELKELPPLVESIVYLSGVEDPLAEFLPTRRRIVSINKAPQIIQFVTDKLEGLDKLVLVCYHKETIDIISEHFKENSITLNGGLSNSEKQSRLEAFKTNKKFTLLIGQLNVIGFGTDGLQNNCNYIVFGELDWTPGSLDQAKDRLRRIGQSKTVFCYYLIASATIEEQIDLKVEWKRKIIGQLIKPTEKPWYETIEV